MKKILVFSIAVLMASVMAYAQNLSLVYEGNPIPANQEIMFEGLANGNLMVFEVQVQNNSSNSMDVLVKKVENYLAEGTTNSFCWGGMCYPPNVYVSPNATTIPGGGISPDGEFSGDYNPGTIIGQSSISYVFFDSSNENDSVMVTVLFTTTATGLTPIYEKEFVISEPYPNPANGFVKFDYDLNQSFNGQLKVYSLVGSLVKEMNITDQSGTIQVNTAKLEEGFYFYILSSSGKEMKTGRFIVSH
jgi:hypothetical protein